MATISTSGISPSLIIRSSHLLRIINALDGTTSDDIIISGSLNALHVTGSFKGDGSQLTGITGEWDGSLNGNAEITGSLIVSGGVVDIGTGTSYPYDYKLKVDSGTDTFGIIALGGGTSFTGLGIGNTTSGRAELYLDASNGDFSGGDYAWIAQNNDLSLELTTGPASNGNIQLKPNDVTSLELFANGSASFSGNVTINNILTLAPRVTTPASPIEGMIIASGSAGASKLYYYNGTIWNALF